MVHTACVSNLMLSLLQLCENELLQNHTCLNLCLLLRVSERMSNQ